MACSSSSSRRRRRSQAFLLWPTLCPALPGYLWPHSALCFLLLSLAFCAGACPEICSCSSSGKVDCMDHRLRFVPDNLPTNATSILLDSNRITLLPDRCLEAQNALRRLSLRTNTLVSIQPLALTGLGRLEELDLSGNYLSLLLPETFLQVPGLKTLNLGNNRLLRLPAELVAVLPRLQLLSLQGNALASLRTAFFENLPPSLRSLRLDNNPWVCSCDIQPLSQWLTDNTQKVPEADSVSCLRPSFLARHPITAFGNGSFALCQAPWLRPPDYTFFLLVGPSTFFASVCLCLFVGLLAVARRRVMVHTYVRPGALARRAEHHLTTH